VASVSNAHFFPNSLAKNPGGRSQNGRFPFAPWYARHSSQ